MNMLRLAIPFLVLSILYYCTPEVPALHFGKSRRPLAAVMQYPNYRGLVLPHEAQKEAEILVTLHPERIGVSRRDARLVGKIRRREDGRILVQVDAGTSESEEVSIFLPIMTLDPGEYTIELSLFARADNARLDTLSYELKKLGPDDVLPSVYIGKNKAIYVDGKPFFPIGWFTESDPRNLREVGSLAEMGFNCIMNYGINQYHNGGSIPAIAAYLEEARKKNVKIIYSLKDMFDGYKRMPRKVGPFRGEEAMVKGVVSRFKDSPAILAWYTSDERPVSWMDRLKKHYDWARDLDRNHPVWICQNRPEELGEYAGVTDILGVDPYPVPERPVTAVSEAVKTANAVTGNAFPIIAVIQTHGSFQYGKNGRAPTAEEVRVMTYLALVEGAKGILYYSYFDFIKTPGYRDKLPSLKKLAKEISMISPVLLEGVDTEPPDIAGDAEGFRVMAKTYGGSVYWIVLNTEKASREITLSVPKYSRQILSLLDSRSLSPNGNRMTDIIGPYGVHVYRSSRAAETISPSRTNAAAPSW